MMTVNQLFKLYAAYSEGKTIMRKTEERHSGYFSSHSWGTIEEVDFGELKLEDLMDVDEYENDGEVHNTTTYTFFIKGEEENKECEDEDEGSPRPNTFGL